MRPRPAYYFLAIAIIPLLIVLQDPRIREPVHGVSLSVMKPFLMAGHSAQEFVADTRDTVVQFWRTFQDQSALESQVTDLEGRLIKFDETLKENERLKRLLDFKEKSEHNSIAARVIGYDLSPWRKTLILDKGSEDGIRKDMAVVVPEGLVGRILEVGLGTSRVLLLIDPDASVPALTMDSRAQGAVNGDGSPVLSMRYLQLDTGVQVEEVVLTSGIGGLFPKDLRIGVVESVSRDDDGLHLVAKVKPYVPFSKLEEVLCLVSYPQK